MGSEYKKREEKKSVDRFLEPQVEMISENNGKEYTRLKNWAVNDERLKKKKEQNF